MLGGVHGLPGIPTDAEGVRLERCVALWLEDLLP